MTYGLFLTWSRKCLMMFINNLGSIQENTCLYSLIEQMSHNLNKQRKKYREYEALF